MYKKLTLLILINNIYAEDGLQSWIAHTHNFRISNSFSGEIYDEIDSEGFVNQPYYHLTESSISYKINNNHSITPMFRFGQIRTTSKWIKEYSPAISYNGTINLSKSIDMFYEVQGMYRAIESRKNRDVLKFKLGLKLKHKDTLSFNIYDELMHGYLGFNKFDNNRIAAGFSAKINKHFSVTSYYLRDQYRTSTKHSWSQDNVIGFILGISY